MNMFDILVSIKGELEWVTDIYTNDLNRAITDAIQLVGKAEYVGHIHYSLVNGQWVGQNSQRLTTDFINCKKSAPNYGG